MSLEQYVVHYKTSIFEKNRPLINEFYFTEYILNDSDNLVFIV
jgi:hypothetical protein